MKKLFGMSLVMWVLLAGMPATGSANQGRSNVRGWGRGLQVNHHSGRGSRVNHDFRRWHRSRGKPAAAVPELDPGAAGTALALLLAGTALLIDRRRSAGI